MKDKKVRYTNNREAPRIKKFRFTEQVITLKTFTKFIKMFPEYKDMKYTEFSAHWNEIAQTYREETVLNPLGAKLGAYTGELKYQYLPYKFKTTNQGASIELGKEVPNTNIMTKGKVGKLKWERRWAVKFNHILQFYGFMPVYQFKKLSEKHTLENPEKIRVSRTTLGGKSVWRGNI